MASPDDRRCKQLPVASASTGNPVRKGDQDYELTSPSQPQIPDKRIKKRSKVRLFAVLTAIYLCTFIAALDQSIIATIIPTITSSLLSAGGYTWIGGAYLLAKAASAPIWVKISDIWGRKLVFLCAVVFFAGSSAICAASKTMTMLLIGRALQGTAAGGLIQLVSVTISDLFSMRDRTLYLGLLETMWAIAGGLGPILGGAFAQKASWRWSFWINLPICGTTFILLLTFLDVHNPRTRLTDGLKAIDWFGSVSILGLTVMLLLGLNFGGATLPWQSPTVICLIVFGVFMSIPFIYSQRSLARYPLMPLSLFLKKSAAASLAVGFVHGFVFLAAEYYLPLYFQSVLSAAPLRSGILVLPIVLTQALMGILTGFIMHRTGRYQELIWAGLILLTIGMGLFIHFSATTSIVEVIVLQMIMGIGSGMLFEPPLIAIQVLAPQDDVATATSTFGFVRNLAVSVSIIVGGAVFQNGMDLQAPHLRTLGLPAELRQQFSGQSAAANVLFIRNIDDVIQRAAIKEAFAWSLRNMWIMYTCISGIGIVASVFITKDHLSTEHTETRTGIRKEQPLGVE